MHEPIEGDGKKLKIKVEQNILMTESDIKMRKIRQCSSCTSSCTLYTLHCIQCTHTHLLLKMRGRSETISCKYSESNMNVLLAILMSLASKITERVAYTLHSMPTVMLFYTNNITHCNTQIVFVSISKQCLMFIICL